MTQSLINNYVSKDLNKSTQSDKTLDFQTKIEAETKVLFEVAAMRALFSQSKTHQDRWRDSSRRKLSNSMAAIPKTFNS